jgi:2-dehydro-3-deoxygalactonokinase
MEATHFFSCDWGTSSFRLRLVSLTRPEIVEELREDCGVKGIQIELGDAPGRHEYARAFAGFLHGRLEVLGRRRGIADISQVPVIISGMASSSVGWRELPYATMPFPLDGSRAVVERVAENDLAGHAMRVWLISGVRTASDIMRGEETEIMGLAAGGFDLDEPSVMILPGSHAKHVWSQKREITGFQTCMTGELCDVLARHSLLRVSVRWPLEGEVGSPDATAAFAQGVEHARAQGLTRGLFRVRTRTVLDGVDPGLNGWFLSGLLIGDELIGLLEDSRDRRILLAGSVRFSGPYELALRALGVASRVEVIPPGTIEQATTRAHAVILGRVIG